MDTEPCHFLSNTMRMYFRAYEKAAELPEVLLGAKLEIITFGA